MKRVFRSFSIMQSKAAMSDSTMQLADGVLRFQRHSLAKAITLVESTRGDHRHQSDLLMDYLMKQRKPNGKLSIRIGVAGPPGAGKSTFIEQLGIRFINSNNRVAVIPVDPSSHVSGGSILGDKTRMETLSKAEQAYVRPSPTRGVLGGIAEHTSDVISLCESAGYNVVIVESVGLGQSEVDIDTAVDMLLLLIPPANGDSLQAAKKGIMEAADLVLINKADGPLLETARHTKSDYAGAMHFIRQKHSDWRAKVMMISAQSGLNMDQVEREISSFVQTMTANGQLVRKRDAQSIHWMREHIQRLVLTTMTESAAYQQGTQRAEEEIRRNTVSPRMAAQRVFDSLGYNPAN